MQEKFFKIRIGGIIANIPLNFSLYVYINKHYTLYLREGDVISEEKIKNFQEKKIDVFFVLLNQKKSYDAYVSQQINNEKLIISERAKILKYSALSVIENLFEDPNFEEPIKSTENIIKNFFSLMEKSPEAMSQLVCLSGHDFYTYTHSLHVSIYSLGLGKILSYSGTDLYDLAQGGLLHDIGKRYIDLNIICKPGPLNNEEWEEMKKHPQYGLSILDEDPNASDLIKICCFEHHEDYGGDSGYPQEIRGEEIHPMARIVSIADTFDALTTQRTYNNPRTPKEALIFMKEKINFKFDPEMLKAMCSIIL